jgi:biotin transport system substrate-specific component
MSFRKTNSAQSPRVVAVPAQDSDHRTSHFLASTAGVPGWTIGGRHIPLPALRRPATRSGIILLRAGISLGMIGVLAASSWISVPFYPVPLTLQTLAVLVIGGLLGPVWGASTVASYLALGLLGAPVFHSGMGGLGIVLGPTGGYLVGFLPAVVLMGLFVRRSSATQGWARPVWLWSGAIVASAAIYACGLPWLGLFTGMGLARTLSLGLVPFLLGDALKLAVAAEGIRRARSRRSTRL